MKRTPAEVAAAVGTVEACWDSYRDHVVRPTVEIGGLPPNVAEYVGGARLDFYAGASSVFQILRCMYEQGKPPGGHVLLDLETEVAQFLESSTKVPPLRHKAGHA